MPTVNSNGLFASTNQVASYGATIRRDFQVSHDTGLTMLRCSQLIENFSVFSGKVTISNGAISVDGRSMIDLLQLAAVTGTVLTIELTGRNADEVMNRISPLLTQ